jgi:enamine deaminase RidA (YjgF/YER057c/UK114 family)
VSKKKGLQRHYDRLEADERFRLDVLAMAREDSRESERLVSSCPRFSYTMNEMGFVERWRSAIEMTLRIYIPLGEQLAKLQMIDDFRVFVPYSQTLNTNLAFDAYFKGHESGSRHAWACAGKGGAPPAWPEDGPEGEIVEPEEEEQDPAMEREAEELEVVAEQYDKFFPDVLEELERRCVKEAFGIWTGYATFCEKSAGVGAEDLAVVVLAPALDQIGDMRARAERLGVEPDAQLVEQVREALAEAWRIVEARGA